MEPPQVSPSVEFYEVGGGENLGLEHRGGRKRREEEEGGKCGWVGGWGAFFEFLLRSLAQRGEERFKGRGEEAVKTNAPPSLRPHQKGPLF